jgi:hypothetical protein
VFMNRALVFAGFAAVGLLSVGCGSSSPSATTSPHPTPTAIATAAATPTPDVRAIAARQYLAAMTTYNLAVDAATAAFNKLSTGPYSVYVPSQRALYKAMAAREQAVFAIHFPPGMAADVSALVSADNSDQVTLLDFINSPNQSTWDTSTLADTAASSASNAVRLDLGLPPVP